MTLRLILALMIAAGCARAAAAATPAIADPVEAKAYLAALRAPAPLARAAALEAFATKYPRSAARIAALDEAMSDYQDAGQDGNAGRVASLVLDADPTDLSALVTATYLTRTAAADGDPLKLAALDAYAVRGLAALPGWKRSAGMSLADFTALRAQTTAVFYGAHGFAALGRKDFAQARDAYLRAFAAAPNAVDAYQLGTVDLQMTPLDTNGFWYVARAVALLQARGAADGAVAVGRFGRTYYAKYHGSEDGWDALLAAAATQTAPPPGFAVSPRT